MKINARTIRLIEKITGTHVYQVVPHGIDLVQDIARRLPVFQAEIVFDVGANIGQSAKKYLDWFPKSKIYCFEPVKDTFYELQKNFKGNDHIHCFQLAFGASKRKGEMVLQGTPDIFFLLDSTKSDLVNTEVVKEKVDVETLDEFCSERQIDHISFLKIDTEGGDLDVLRGSENMLSKQTIDMVEVEAGMNCKNERHVPFETLKQYLESKKYFLFGIYEQVNERFAKEPHLRRANPVFISEQMIKANKS
jgi:FkbM family methyltransferase